MLALAAYNMGESRLKKLVETAEGRGSKADFWSLPLPRETRVYVPKFLGLVELVDRPSKYAFKLPRVADEPRIEVVKLPAQIELDVVAALTGISRKELRNLNPGFRRWATDPDGPHQLVVPYGKGESVRATLAETPTRQLVRWDGAILQQGETVESIAADFGVEAAVLRKVNRLPDRVPPGTPLRIPATANLHHEPAYPAAPESHMAAQRSYVVRDGDSLWLIARRENLPIDVVARWNNLKPSATLKPGRKLNLGPSEAPSAAIVKTSAQPAAAGSEKTHYKVRNGDSLSTIAERFKVTVRDLMRWNSLAAPHRIRTGQILRIAANPDESPGT
jgi:membrane-bound lytic murein transglycosylase D